MKGCIFNLMINKKPDIKYWLRGVTSTGEYVRLFVFVCCIWVKFYVQWINRYTIWYMFFFIVFFISVVFIEFN